MPQVGGLAADATSGRVAFSRSIVRFSRPCLENQCAFNGRNERNQDVHPAGTAAGPDGILSWGQSREMIVGCGRWLQLPSLSIWSGQPPPLSRLTALCYTASHWTVSTVPSEGPGTWKIRACGYPFTFDRPKSYCPQRRQRSPCPSPDRSRPPWLVWLCVVPRLTASLVRPAKRLKTHSSRLPKSAPLFFLSFLP